jgi:type III secretion protein V
MKPAASAVGAATASLRGLWRQSPRGGALAGRYSDIVLAFGVVAIVTLMILPLPLLLIDTLVAVNILFGVALLLLAIYIPAPTAFASFPSVLLLTTLFRLSLSIAITRMILLQADAGHIIDTFGNMVAGGNLVVGIVVFLIITVVQFIVIAKGAERVAEVAARFSLDAMPGKQLSIDSDLRSGLVDKDEARRKRRMLEIESQLHGSLDGAMKFVKGDAIAGIVIIIINILGGLAIGVLQRGLPLSEAMHTYSILTIGDGMVAQIPALLSAIAAGLIVTRTASEEQDAHLGQAIARQVSGHPRVMLIGGVLALLLATVPGFPAVVFGFLGLLMLGGFAWRARARIAPLRRWLQIEEPAAPPVDAEVVGADADLRPPPPLALDVDAGLVEALGRERLLAAANKAAERVREEYGVPVPTPTLRVSRELPRNGYRAAAFGVRIAFGELQPQAQFRPALPAPPGGSEALQARSAFLPALHGEWSALVADGGGFDAPCVLRLHLEAAMRRQLGLFLGIQETSNLIQRWSRDYPDLIKEMFRVVSPQRAAEVLKRLVEEGLPVRNLRDVFEAITEAGAREKDILLLTEYVRVALRRHISDRYASQERILHALIAHPELEDTLRQSVRGGNAMGAQLAIDPQLLTRLLGEIRQLRATIGENFDRVVLLSSMDVRRHLRKLTESEFFDLPVLSFQELAADVQIVPLGQVHG